MQNLGHVHSKIKLVNPRNGRELYLEGLVDTGETFTVVPSEVADSLGLQPIGKRKVRTASGEEELEESYAIIEVLGERTTTPILKSPKIDRTLIGVLTLEALALKIDPKTGRLEKTELLLM